MTKIREISEISRFRYVWSEFGLALLDSKVAQRSDAVAARRCSFAASGVARSAQRGGAQVYAEHGVGDPGRAAVTGSDKL